MYDSEALEEKGGEESSPKLCQDLVIDSRTANSGE